MSTAGFDLSGKCAVVIGGTSGIGRAIALGLAKAGADVVPASRRMEEARKAAAEIESLGRSSMPGTCDVCVRDSVQQLHDKVVSAFGGVHILVNSAGTTRRIPTLDCPEEEWSRIFDTNLTGTLRSCQVFGKSMIQRGNGRIINIASLSTFVAFYEVAAYSASKAAVGSLTKSLAVEWAPFGVTVNGIAPGVFSTALNETMVNGTGRGREILARTPMKRLGKVEELVGAAVFLASDLASFVTGEILVVDGGFLASGVNQ